MSYVQLSGAGFQVAYPVSLWAPGPLSGVVKVLSGDGLHCNYVFVYSYMGRRSPAHSARQLGAAQRTARGSRGRLASHGLVAMSLCQRASSMQPLHTHSNQ